MTPSRLVSIWLRNSSSEVCSIGAVLAPPALLATTSSRPKVSTAAATARSAAAASLTSSATGLTRSP